MSLSKLLRKPVLGVDLGSRTLKGIRLKEKNGRVQLDRHFFQDLSSVSDQFPNNPPTAESFKAAVEVQALNSARASTTLRDSDVMTFTFAMPKMNKKELEIAVRHELAEHTQMPIDQITYDYQLTHTKNEEGNREIRAYCAKRDQVMDKFDSLKNAGLRCTSVESEMKAIISMLEFNGYLAAGQTQVVIDIGESHVSLGLVVDGDLKGTRDSEIGMGAINQALQERFGMSYRDAEFRKRSYTFSADTNGLNERETEVHHCIDDTVTQIFRVIKDGLDFFREHPEVFGRIDRILIVGGGSQLSGIARVHELLFKIPTTIPNPLKNIDIFGGPGRPDNDEIAQLAPYLSTAVGLALATIEEEAA